MNKKALIIIDVNNGFAKRGNLYNPRVEALIEPIKNYAKLFKGKLVAFTDTHKEDCLEFGSYPVHCLDGTWESEVVDELKDLEGLLTIPKNSTNGFHEELFKEFLVDNPEIDTFEIVGCCTDICVYQFAITLKTYFTMNNKQVDVIVHKDMVDTFDVPEIHDADKLNESFLNSMVSNGIIVK